MTAEPSSYRVECSREDLVRAIELLWAARTRGSSINIAFVDGEMTFRRGATSVRVSANGTWQGTAEVSAQFVRDLRRRRTALPDPVVIVGEVGRLSISHYAIPCSWA